MNTVLHSPHSDTLNLPYLQYIQYISNHHREHIKKQNTYDMFVFYSQNGDISIQKNLLIKGGQQHPYNVQPILCVDTTFCHKDRAHTICSTVYVAKVRNLEDCILPPYESFYESFFETLRTYIGGIHESMHNDILAYVKDRLTEKKIPSTLSRTPNITRKHHTEQRPYASPLMRPT
jgi:hypothetical protein